MFFGFGKCWQGIALVAGLAILAPGRASAVEDSIFSRPAPDVVRGTLDLGEPRCVDARCAAALSSAVWDRDASGQHRLFRADGPVGRTGMAANPAAAAQAGPANVLNSVRSDRGLLTTHQAGTGNRMTAVQDPLAFDVRALLVQVGQDNQMIGLQQGSDNVATVTQTGNQNVASYAQAGTGNVLTIRQR